VFVQRLANHDNEFQELSAGLFELLLKPAARVLENKTLLIIAPDGPLWNLPFQTLRATAGHYLIESTAISYAPSFTVLTGTFALARYNANGTLDGSFGAGGRVTTKVPFGDDAGAAGVAIQSDGKIVAAGNPFNPQGGSAFALARYNSTAFDTCIMNQTGTVFQWNSKTGAYELNACNGTTISGKGTVALVNSILTLTDFKSDRRIGVAFSTAHLTGRATIYILIAPGECGSLHHQRYHVTRTGLQLRVKLNFR
jgi:hypothetical protein